ncbi:hypothetical protein BBJ28_00020989 [Nothophytophthora sp. Chile5]|nr:hypothetical protein BBJ28_00020989 [Nothophytophthora sp. Chile5]
MKQNPDSHLTRFYGCHSIEMYGQEFSFVVMGNAIGRTSMHQFYDIKGSWVDRNAAVRIMDYSLLLSVHSTKYVVEHSAMDSIEPSPTKRKVNYPVCHPDSNDTFLSVLTDAAEQTEVSSDEDLAEVESGNRRKFNRNCRYSVVNQFDEGSVKVQADTPLLDHSVQRYDSVSYGPVDMDSRTVDDSTWVGTRTVEKRGYQACVVIGPDYYTLGVVDMLQTWTWSKRMERLWKTLVLRHDGLGISAAPPKLYAERFQRKMRDVLMVSSTAIGFCPS